MTITPKDYVDHMRDRILDPKFKDNYFAFEQALHNRIAQKKLDEDSKKGVNQVATLDQAARRHLRPRPLEPLPAVCEE